MAEYRYICEYCKEEFVSSRTRSRKNKMIFCSRTHWGLWKSANLRGENSPAWKGAYEITVCAACGNQIRVKRYKMKDRQRHYCDDECRALGISKYYSGENSPSYNGGVNVEKERTRGRNDYYKNREERIEKVLLRSRKQREGLSYEYIVQRIKAEFNNYGVIIKTGDIPKEFIVAKKLNLQLKREIKSLKEVANGNFVTTGPQGESG